MPFTDRQCCIIQYNQEALGDFQLQPCVAAYLDIETTGLSPRHSEITVVGIHICSGTETQFIQLVGDAINADCILEALERVQIIYTYNGSRFDLPFIYYRLGINLAELFPHRDLMYDCWENNLYGGLKKVEKQIPESVKV